MDTPSHPHQAALDAAAAILEPLAALLLGQQVRFAQAEELLKAAFVQASARAYAAQGKAATVSSLSVATGLRRREVKRLAEAADARGDAAVLDRRISPARQARLRWMTDPRFLDARGRPRPLQRAISDAASPSFAELAATVSKDTHPRALLDELLRIGVAVEEGETVVLRQRLPSAHTQGAKLEVGSANVSDHLWAVLVNLMNESSPLMERAVFADGLTEASARRGADLARDVWSHALAELRDKLQAMVDADADAPDNTWRMRIGIYGYMAPTDRPPAPVNVRAKKSARPRKTQGT